VISYAVGQRTGEFGIRMALGAMRKDVLLMVFRSAAMSVAGGVLTGVVLTITLNRVLARWIRELSRCADPSGCDPAAGRDFWLVMLHTCSDSVYVDPCRAGMKHDKPEVATSSRITPVGSAHRESCPESSARARD